MKAVAVLLVGLAAAAAAQEAEDPALAGADATEIARRADDVLRGERTYLEAKLTVSTPRRASSREVVLRAWEDRSNQRSFVRVLSPSGDAGTGFLWLPPNLWIWEPRTERTLRIPSSKLLDPWMESDFTHDDLVHASSEVEDYDHRLLRVDESPEGHPGRRAWVIEYLPHEDAPVAWGRILAWIDVERGTPLRQDFYDGDGTPVRTLRFEDVRDVHGRPVPFRRIVRSLEKEGHETRIEIEEILFDPELDPAVFTTRNLRARP